MISSIQKRLLISFCLGLVTFFTNAQETTYTSDFTIAFGSCNRVDLPNPFWNDIASKNADVFIWGGDVIYADTEDMTVMEAMYKQQKANPDYKAFAEKTEILGTWDDHDYGINDGGASYGKKHTSQNLFLDFLNVPKDAKVRDQEGVYTSKNYYKEGKWIKIIILDTRYFRSDLTDSEIAGKRYEPNTTEAGTILGAEQWSWLEKQFEEKSDFCVVMSSIQFLSAEHGFETWGNFPSEIERFENLVKNANAQRVVLLSGDRHISEFSRKNIEGIDYPLIDFTSSGLTHSYSSYSGEPNQYRVGDVISVRSYGLLNIDLDKHIINFKIMGVNDQILSELSQHY
ncbi:MAG: alkaline phosphatase family protein [Leeuwenhoekiella sp.]|nr:alkaline phosphatase family protein [Leeuwenhoekiella sp.]